MDEIRLHILNIEASVPTDGDGDGEITIKDVLLLKYPRQIPKKVLCLHGGGGSAQSMRNQMSSLMESASEYEYVFAEAPEPGNLWIKDPPNGKDTPTTDEDWAINSVSHLNNITQGDPYHALVGYSQGGAMAVVYLSNVSADKFEKVLFFSGYTPSTHTGLVDRIATVSPLQIPALIYRGYNDFISTPMIDELAQKFESPIVIDNSTGDHSIPTAYDDNYDEIVDFLKS